MSKAHVFFSDPDHSLHHEDSPEPEEVLTPPDRHRRRRLGWRGKTAVLLMGGTALAVGASKLGFHIGDLLNPNPGQAQGPARLPEAFIDKLRTSDASAVGSAVVHVPRAEQVWTDDDGKTAHETQIFENGTYRVQWQVIGRVTIPKPVTSQGQQTITLILPKVERGAVDTVVPPNYNRDKSLGKLALPQRLNQELLGADRTEERAGRRAFADALRRWGSSDQAGMYQAGVACTAVAAESAKAAGWADAFGVKANIPQFYGPYQSPPDVIPDAPTVKILTPDPTNPDKMLDMAACRPKLADLGYSEQTGSNFQAEGFGLPAFTIRHLTVPPHKG